MVLPIAPPLLRPGIHILHIGVSGSGMTSRLLKGWYNMRLSLVNVVVIVRNYVLYSDGREGYAHVRA